jgi:hypothetical protein
VNRMLTLLACTGIVWPVPAGGPAPSAISCPVTIAGPRAVPSRRAGRRVAELRFSSGRVRDWHRARQGNNQVRASRAVVTGSPTWSLAICPPR